MTRTPMNPARICVLGSAAVDLTFPVPTIPLPGQTVLGGAVERALGGKGANQAVAAARAGASVRFIGAVGDDDAGSAIRERLHAEGIDTTHIQIRRGAPTGLASIVRAQDGQNAIVVSPGANMMLVPEDASASRDAIAWADLLVLQLEVPMETIACAIQIAGEVGTGVLLNAAPAATLSPDLLAGIDILVANEIECEALARARSGSVLSIEGAPGAEVARFIDHTLARIAALCPSVIATLGPLGCIGARDRRATHVPAFEADAIDTVGAGDAFVGVLATRWAEHKAGGGLDEAAIRDALDWASAAGALACTKRGGMPAMPIREEVRSLLLKG